MIEKEIPLDGIDPLTLYGVNNGKYHLLARHFPRVRIVARGNEMKASGPEEDLQALEESVMRLIGFYQKWGELTERQMQHLLKGLDTPPTGETQLEGEVLVYGPHGKPIQARTPNQRALVTSEEENDLIFAVGPAGSGKTYTAIALAVRALKNHRVKRLILTRPAVEAGERLGFLPGDMKEKLDPYLQPLYDALNDMLPPRMLQNKMDDGTIQIAPLAFMRGRTLDNAYVILDEAQNATRSQLKMFLTRMGRNAKFIVTGDTTQIDLPNPSTSGLTHTMELLKGINGIDIIAFNTQDIVRHPLVSSIVKAFEAQEMERAEEDHA